MFGQRERRTFSASTTTSAMTGYGRRGVGAAARGLEVASEPATTDEVPHGVEALELDGEHNVPCSAMKKTT